MRHIQINDYRQNPAVRGLLTLAADPVDESALQALFDACEHLQVLARLDAAGQVCALAAYRHSDEYSLCVEYLAVLPAHQHRGLASSLMHELQRLHHKGIWATTDDDAVDFYRALGCVLSRSAPDPRWPGTQRYLGTLPHAPLLASQPTEDPGYQEVDGALSRGVVTLVEPQAHWPLDFQALRRVIADALGPAALAIEHTGSTSVPGLPAKPIIDIALIVPDADDEDSYVPQLRAAGLVFWHREPGWYAHRMFKPGGSTNLAPANIHIFSSGSPEYLRMMLFRDHLRTHAEDRSAYAAVKYAAASELLAKDGDQGLIMDYNRIKEPFILALHAKIFAG
ncbi:GNAT family N-acetyltransferase [Glutamicibacter sp.]|uniref:GNAT family N-acetyltransferase n=1 Tax=Glutamicibacter sp. TaxID=1931995 RepID=UPI0028BD7DBB|nr:GNAT family N-acetyltransferase [Glutamicibacter sp.]